MTEKATKITEATLVPLSLLIVAAAGLLWLANIQAVGAENSRELAQLRSEKAAYTKTVEDINQRLSRIEGKLGVSPHEHE
jgi:lipase chaperone LimK